MRRNMAPHQETQITFQPTLIVRSAMVMSVFVVVACLALTSGMTQANADSQQETVVQDGTTASESAVENKSSEECRISEGYPESVRQWCGLITKYADQASLPSDLIAGLIWYESGGDPQAYSRSGAVGLMQVMPRDGIAADFQCVNGPCFSNRPTIAELQDPEFNIQYGIGMLAGLYSRYQDLRAALKSYGPRNAGYTYADKVLAIYERYRGD